MTKKVYKPAAMYGVNEYATKWIVILKRDGKNLAKTFAFSTHGGREAALTQAQSWRDEVIRQHPQVERRVNAQRLKSNNSSGVPGVFCQCWPDGRPMRWVTQTVAAKGGPVLSSSFAVKKHGYEQAKEMAIAAREKHLEQVAGRVSWHPADAIDPDAPPSPR